MSDLNIPGSDLSDGFWAGSQFRTFLEIVDLAPGATISVRASVSVNLLLNKVNLTCDDGRLRVATISGGVESGTFDTPVPVIPKNTMANRPLVDRPSGVALLTGGSVDGGVEIDVIRRSSGGGSARPSVGDSPDEVRGVRPDTYHFKITNNGAQNASGVFYAWWDELTE